MARTSSTVRASSRVVCALAPFMIASWHLTVRDSGSSICWTPRLHLCVQESVEQQTPRRRQRDPNFMGYTYKNFLAVPSSNGASPAALACAMCEPASCSSLAAVVAA